MYGVVGGLEHCKADYVKFVGLAFYGALLSCIHWHRLVYFVLFHRAEK